MKKKYEAPKISIEYFKLTQSIATCSKKIGFLDSECVKKDADSTDQMKDLAWSGFFNTGHCGVSAEGMEDQDGICYHTNLNAAFNS